MRVEERAPRTRCARDGSGTSRAASRPPISSSRAPGAPGSGTPRAASTSTSRAASPARTSATATRRSSGRSTSRSTASSTSASWSAPTSRTLRSREARRALARQRRDEDAARELGRRGDRERGQDLACRDRPRRVVVFDRAFHGRTNLTMAMTSKLVYKQGFGPLATDVHRAPAPYPYRGSRPRTRCTASSCCSSRMSTREVACIVLEPVQGEGGFIPMPPEFIHAFRELCDTHGIVYVDDEVQSGCGRTGTVWAIERYDVEPDLLVSGKTLGGGLPLAASRSRRADGRAASRRPRRHVRRQPGRVRCVARRARRAVGAGLPRARRADRRLLRTRLDEIAAKHPIVGEVAGSARCSRSS